MRITDVRTYIAGNPWKNWLIARVETDEGIHGVGEGTLNAFARTVEAAIHELRPRYLGMDPFQIETLVQRMTRDVYSEGGQIHGAAVCAVEVACWDIIGKATGQPIYNLLGGRYHERLRAYANGWYRGERTPEAVASAAREVVARGYTALKFDPFGVAYRVADRHDEDLSVAIVEAVRDAVGPDVDILVEGHSRFSVATALRVAERIAPFNPSWFEEPTHHRDMDAVVEVARRSPVPIATGESFSSTHEFAELLSREAVHILQPEPIYLGGLWNARKVCAMADAHYAVVAPHNAQGPVATAMCVQLGACTPNLYVQELFDEFNVDWERRVVDHPVEVVDGYITVPERPGLGIEVDFDEVARHPYQPQHFLPLFAPGWERRVGEA
ncbi:MAG TPA: mandelate racemase/muconate lactonizing enzyme family protein [Thermomicrobiaceae bacterium]|nr:mandelate racemase/muconate lactonizing enzyme family protein [Thermomicrobiaceae bacterium]